MSKVSTSTHLSSVSLAPGLPDSNRRECFRLNTAQIKYGVGVVGAGLKPALTKPTLTNLPIQVQVWGTRCLPGVSPPLAIDEVAMLRADTANRLVPLLRQMTAGKPVLTGLSEDQNDLQWWASLKIYPNFDAALGVLQGWGVDTEIIDFLHYEPAATAGANPIKLPFEQVGANGCPVTPGLLSIGFMQLIPYLSGRRAMFREISLDDVVQVIFCWV